MSIFEILSILDFFKLPIFLTFSKKKLRSTSFGIVLSIFIIAFLVYEFSQSDMFKKENPIVVQQIKETAHASPMFIDQNTLLTMSVTDPSAVRIMDLSIFTVSSIIYHMRNNPNTGMGEQISQETQEWRPCQKEDAPFDESYFEKLSMINSFCLKNKTFKIEGLASDQDFYFMNAELFICNNDTFNNSCKTLEEINDFFNSQSLFLAFGISDIVIDVYDYENPLQFKYYTDPRGIDISLTKISYIYMQPFEMITNDGIITSSNRIQTRSGYSKSTYDFKNRVLDIDPLISIDLFASNRIQTITRRYEQLPDVLAKLFGLLSSIKTIFFLITNKIVYYHTLKKFLPKLYSIKQKTNKSKIIKKGSKIITDLPRNNEKPNKKNIELINNYKEYDNNLIKTQLKKNISLQDVNVELIKTNIVNPVQNKNNVYFITKSEKKEQSFYPQLKVMNDSFNLEHFSNMEFKETQVQNVNLKNLISNTKDRTSLNDEINIRKHQSLPNEKKYDNPIIDMIKIDRIEKNWNNKVKNRWNISIYEILKHEFGKYFGFKNKNIEKADKTFNKELDITRILKILKSLELLKAVLMDKNQLIVFNSLSKPLLDLKNNEEIENKQLKIKDFINVSKNSQKQKNIILIKEAITEVKNRCGDKSDINSRLFTLFEEKLTC